MITIENFMTTVEYRITDGSEFLWSCYGPDARTLSFDDSDFCVSMVFDTKNQTVYEATVYDYRRDVAYRRLNPEYSERMISECRERDIDPKVAWDLVEFVDLEVDEDWIDKAVAIINGTEYDTRVQVPVDLTDEEWFTLMKMAHEQDITLNQLLETVLFQVIERSRETAPKIQANKKKSKKEKS